MLKMPKLKEVLAEVSDEVKENLMNETKCLKLKKIFLRFAFEEQNRRVNK